MVLGARVLELVGVILAACIVFYIMWRVLR